MKQEELFLVMFSVAALQHLEIELLQAVKEKFGDKNILIHDEQNNLVCGFRDIYLEPGFSYNYDGKTYNVDCEIHISF